MTARFFLASPDFMAAWLRGVGITVMAGVVTGGLLLAADHLLPPSAMEPITLATLDVPAAAPPAVPVPEEIPAPEPTPASTLEADEIPEPASIKETSPSSVVMAEPEPAPSPQTAPPPSPSVAITVDGVNEAFGTKGQTIPMISKDGLTPFEAYRRAVDPALNALPRIALVALPTTSDTVNQKMQAVLPPETAIVLTSATDDNRAFSKTLREQGFEVWQAITLEGADFPLSDPGPLALYGDSSDAENRQNMQAMLALNDGYVGVVPVPLDSPVLSRARLLEMIAEELSLRGLGFATPSKTGRDLSMARFVTRYGHVLHPALSPEQRQAELDALVATARKDGQAILYFDPAPALLDVLGVWAGSLTDHGIALVPLSSLATPAP